MKRLAILSTHPIQYNAPLFRILNRSSEFELKVFYSRTTSEVLFDPAFSQEVSWDIPLTVGYNYESHAASTNKGLRSLIDAITEFQPCTILLYGWNFPGHFSVMKNFHGKVRIWFRGDSTLLDPLPIWKRWMRKAWLNYVYHHIDAAFYVGQANRRYFLWAGLTKDRLIYAPHAVDNDFFMNDDALRHVQALDIRRNLGIPDKSYVFLFVGKLEPIKQPLELASAFREMLQLEASLDAHLLFVGSGVLFKRLALENRDCPLVHLVGFVNQSHMPVYYRVGNCLCLPSVSETWGLAINEFIASTRGSVILSNRVGCGEDVARYLQNTTVINSGDVDSLKKALYKHANENTIEPQANREKFIRNFNFKRIERALHSEFQSLQP
jgi:glycosyltransferase involved in cell wall biosynthesis